MSPKLWTRNYINILCSTFIAYVAFQMLIPTLTVHVRDIHGSNLGASLAYSFAAAAALFARAASGAIMDRIGRKPILMTGLAILIVADLLLYIAPSVPLICLIRLCQGFGWGMCSTALATFVSDVIPSDRVGEGIGYFAISIVLATSLSVVFGIWLMDQYGFTLMLACSTFLFVLAATSDGLFLNSVFKRPRHPIRRRFWQTLIEKSALLPAFLCFLHSVAFSGIITFIMLFGAEKGISNVFVFFIGHVAMMMVTRPFVGKLFDAKGHTVVILPGVLAMIVGLLLLSYAQGVTVLVIASLFYGAGFGTVQPSLQAWALNRASPDRRGATNGTFLSSLDLGYAVGAVLTGAMASASSYAEMYRLSTLFLVLFLIIYAIAVFHPTKGDTVNGDGKDAQEDC